MNLMFVWPCIASTTT